MLVGWEPPDWSPTAIPHRLHLALVRGRGREKLVVAASMFELDVVPGINAIQEIQQVIRNSDDDPLSRSSYLGAIEDLE